MKVTSYKTKQNRDDNSICPDCRNQKIISDPTTADTICSECGLVLESSSIDHGAEWRAFSFADQNKKSRVGSPTTLTLNDKGLSTFIDWKDYDAQGNKLSPTMKANAYRLRKWQIRMRVHTSVDRNLTYAMTELERISSQLGLKRSINESSAKIYRETVERKLIRGRSIEAMIAASVYTACRLYKTPLTLDEICDNSRIEKRELGRCFRLIMRELSIKTPSPKPTKFISRFATELDVSPKTQIIALKILDFAARKGITIGKDPIGMAAASLYIAAIQNGEKKTQKEIAKVSHITEVTIRNRYKELIKHLKMQFKKQEIVN